MFQRQPRTITVDQARRFATAWNVECRRCRRPTVWPPERLARLPGGVRMGDVGRRVRCPCGHLGASLWRSSVGAKMGGA